jgi:hypothetical protein
MTIAQVTKESTVGYERARGMRVKHQQTVMWERSP